MIIRNNLALSDTGFLFDPSTGDSYMLNPVGLEIIHQLKNNASDEHIFRYFTDKYDVDAASFEQYFYDFISVLRQWNLMIDHE